TTRMSVMLSMPASRLTMMRSIRNSARYITLPRRNISSRDAVGTNIARQSRSSMFSPPGAGFPGACSFFQAGAGIALRGAFAAARLHGQRRPLPQVDETELLLHQIAEHVENQRAQ